MCCAGRARSRPSATSTGTTTPTGVYRCAGCDLPLFDSNAKFESGHRLAELLRADRARMPSTRDVDDSLGHGADGGPVRALRRSPRPSLRRRAAADGPALLHELGVAAVRAAFLTDSSRAALRLHAAQPAEGHTPSGRAGSRRSERMAVAEADRERLLGSRAAGPVRRARRAGLRDAAVPRARA